MKRVLRKSAFLLTGILGITVALIPAAFSQTSKKEKPAHGTEFVGRITVSTTADGMQTFITVPPSDKGAPLAAAYVIQHRSAARIPLEFSGEGRLIYRQDAMHHALGVWVKPDSTEGWLFKLDRYGGDEPPTSIEVAGIATYAWKKGAQRFPSSHSEFVQEQLGPSSVEKCDGVCDCAGGQGATQCNCGAQGFSCGVSCGSGYYACCKNTGWCRCCPN